MIEGEKNTSELHKKLVQVGATFHDSIRLTRSSM